MSCDMVNTDTLWDLLLTKVTIHHRMTVNVPNIRVMPERLTHEVAFTVANSLC